MIRDWTISPDPFIFKAKITIYSTFYPRCVSFALATQNGTFLKVIKSFYGLSATLDIFFFQPWISSLDFLLLRCYTIFNTLNRNLTYSMTSSSKLSIRIKYSSLNILLLLKIPVIQKNKSKKPVAVQTITAVCFPFFAITLSPPEYFMQLGASQLKILFSVNKSSSRNHL